MKRSVLCGRVRVLRVVWASTFVAIAGIAAPRAADAGVTKDWKGALPVRIEILPGDSEKWVDPILGERVPVVVFGGETLDVRDVDPTSVVLAGAAVSKADDGSLASYRDVDGDGTTDLVVEFVASGLRADQRRDLARLWGRTRDGKAFAGAASMRTVDAVRAEHRRALATPRDEKKVEPLRARIDVLPRDPANRIELGNRGTVSVALLSAPGFDATRVDPLTLYLAGSPVTRRQGRSLASFEDTNADGLADLVVEVSKKLLRIAPGATEIQLTGRTPEGRFLVGSDRIALAETATLTFDSDDPRPAPQPQAVEFANDGAITINDLTTATPYPSIIAVSGIAGVISKVRVTLKGLSHAYPDDIDALLVGPTGQSLLLMSDVGGFTPVSNLMLTFDDDAALQLDSTVAAVTGTYRPSSDPSSDTFPAPAPAPTAETTLEAFEGTNPNGTWSLYLLDDAASDTGTIASGWAIDFVMAAEFCNGGAIAIPDAAPAALYPSPITVSGVPGVIAKVTVALRGVTHSFPADIDTLLVHPLGAAAATTIFSDTAGGNPGVSNVDLVLDDNAPISFDPGANPTSGTYRPDDEAPVSEALPAPAPAGPFGSRLARFEATPPNGTWNLWVADDAGGDTGSIARGWCLRLTTLTPIDNTNPASITIPSGAPGTTSGPATPYPSSIEVSGAIGSILKTSVTLRGLTHTFPADLDVLLTPPPGVPALPVLLMSDVDGGAPGVSGVTYTFEELAPSPLPVGSNAPSGTYQPTNDNSGGADVFPAPAPAGPYATSFSFLSGSNPNGTWKLYVYDDKGGDVGSLASGWKLTLQTRVGGYGACNFDGLTIPAGAPGTTNGPASVYPSVLNISFVTPTLDESKLRVELVGLSHSYPLDLDVLVVGPQGQKALLMSDAAGVGPGVSNVDLFFDSDASAGLAQFSTPTSGTYRPTDFELGDLLPGPAPGGPYPTSLSVFKGTSPLGNWSLYVSDDASGDVGSLQGWCVFLDPSIDADEVPSLRFASASSITWSAGPNAIEYNVYRGAPGQLASLADHGIDSCLRGTTLGLQFPGVSEAPTAGSFYWYLVRGSNVQGEGPAGFSRFRSQILARIEDSSGACP